MADLPRAPEKDIKYGMLQPKCEKKIQRLDCSPN